MMSCDAGLNPPSTSSICYRWTPPWSGVIMASGQGDIPGNATVWIHVKNTRAIILIKVFKISSKASDILSFMPPFSSPWVWHVRRPLWCNVITYWNDSTQHQLWRAHRRSHAFTSCRRDYEHLLERPRHPPAQVLEHRRGASCSFKLFGALCFELG